MKYLSVLLFLLASLTFTSCGDDDDSMEVQTIVDIAAGDAQFSTLVAALQRTNLVGTLEGDGPFTVFAPTNAAFVSLGVDLNTISDQELTDILLYHVLSGATVQSTDIAQGQTYASTASTGGVSGNALSMLIENSNGVQINGSSNVTTADISASNGVIHVIDKVLLPLDIVGHATANSNFTSLVGALGSANGDLVTVLSGTGPFTVFAPLNSAFDAIADVVATLTADQLTTVLTYHVVGGANVLASDLSNDMSVTTVSGQDFTVDLSNGAQLIDQAGSSSTILLTDVQATNGVIHVLEKVIIPSL